MNPKDAIVLDNYFPSESEIALRNGHTSHATGIGGSVETLMHYATGATKELKAAGNSGIFDVTSAGAVGAAEVTGLTNTKFQYVNFGTAGGNFLWVCNGADQERYYNGSTWATATLTGVSAGDIVNVHAHVNRLFMVIKDSLKYCYLPVNSISGTVSVVNLSSVFNEGGKLIACASWSVDGGEGGDDRMCFITDRGEVAVYSGTDPSSASTWTKINTYKIGAPVGQRCYFKVAGDLAIITQDGFMPMSRVLATDRVSPELALSDKIAGAVKTAVRLYGSTFGWQCLLYPKGGYGLFNVPRTGGIYDQYIVNTTTLAWCRFTGQNGVCWAVHDDNLYFGDENGTVFKADSGLSDNGSAILGDAKQAFNYFGDTATKRFTLIRPTLSSDATLPVSMTYDVDYDNSNPAYTPSTVTSVGTPWGSPWGSPWASSDEPITDWFGMGTIGKCIAPRIRTSTTAQRVSWQATDYMWEPGIGI